LLHELGAIEGRSIGDYRITKIGKHLAHLPIDPRLARMLLQAKNEQALSEVLIIVSALATQDPRDRPMDRQQAADEKHAAFKDKASDFLFYINLWRAYHEEKAAVSGNQLRKWCRKHFISWMRMREWIDTHNQIKRMLTTLKLKFNTTEASYEQIHRSLLIGLLGNLGLKTEDKEYLGARNKKFHVFPGSTLFKSAPKWIMSAEIVETTRVYARTNAKIDVAWVEQLAGHLLKRHYNNPHWEKRRSQVVAHEQATLYGLMITTDKKVNYGRINPVQAKEIFIRGALVEGDFDCRADFFVHNQKLLQELEAQEAKSRRRDIIVDEDVLYDFYNERLPEQVVSGQTLDKWLRQQKGDKEGSNKRKKEGKINRLFLDYDDLIRDDAELVSDKQFPDRIDFNGSSFPIEYHFDPRNHCDGITLITPVAGLNLVNPQRCEWLIPGLLQEKIVALIRSLPKQLRKNFVPVPNFADACIEALEPSDTPLCTAIAAHLKKMTGVLIPYDAWRPEAISQHLLMNFRVIDADGSVIEEGRNLQAIKDKLSGQLSGQFDESVDENMLTVQQSMEAAGEEYNRDDVGAEALERVGDKVELDLDGITVQASLALVKEGKRVHLRAIEDRQRADQETSNAIRQLFINALPEQVKHLRSSIPDAQNLCLKYSDFGRCDDLKADVINSTFDEVFMAETIESESDFNTCLEKGKAALHDKMLQWCQLLSGILDEYRAIKKLLKKPALTQLDTVSDIQAQLNALFPDNFITSVEHDWLKQYPRYLAAISKRFEKSKSNATRDRQLRLEFNKLWDEYEKRQAALEKQHIDSEQLRYYRWMLEEYRVSLFAQELRTRFPVSEKRLKKYWAEMSDA